LAQDCPNPRVKRKLYKLSFFNDFLQILKILYWFIRKFANGLVP
jgi:hypothetical protein